MRALKNTLLLPKKYVAARRRALEKWRAERHKSRLAHFHDFFVGEPDVVFVFQFHNKGKNVSAVLRPFLEEIRPRNIIAFSDGCSDTTTKKLEDHLNGRNHLTICRNDTHEISNYRLAVEISRSLGARYVALFQDDDVYLSPVKGWLKTCQKQMEADRDLAIIGLNGGANFNSDCYIQRADTGLCHERFETLKLERPTPDGATANILGTYIRSEAPALEKTTDGSKFRYVASVNRAPQFMRISDAIDLCFFPEELEPYQYDDYFNCFSAWEAGRKVMLAPISGKRGLGEGGMRLYNNANRNNRPQHFIRNHNLIYERFGSFANSGRLQRAVASANTALATTPQTTP